jgi:hypothetical protein
VKNALKIGVVAILLISIVGCSAHIHKVGNGAQMGYKQQERQWYVLWGLVPINDVDTHAMAADATDYTIKTEQSALDVIINIFTGMITIYSRTVTVEK